MGSWPACSPRFAVEAGRQAGFLFLAYGLWLIVSMANKLNFPLILTLILIAIFFATAITTSSDTYWHMAVGREIVQTKHIPTQDNFTYGQKDKSFNSSEWLSGLIFYSLFQNFGQNGLVILRILIAIATLFVLYKTLDLVTKNLSVQILALEFSAFMLSFRFKDRPEIFAYLFVAFTNYICLHYFFKKKLPTVSYFLPLIFLLWPNMHPSVYLGFGIIGFYLTLFTFRIFLKLDSLKSHIQFFLLSLVSVCLSLIQFKRLSIIFDFQKLQGHDLTEFGSILTEWQRAKGYQPITQMSLSFYLYLALSLAFLTLLIYSLFKTKNITSNKILWTFYFLLLLMPIKLFRLVPITTLLATPAFLYIAKNNLKSLPKIPILAKTFVVFMSTLLFFSIIQGQTIGNTDYQQIVFYQEKSGDSRPVGAINRIWNTDNPKLAGDFIKNNLETKHLFTSAQWNNYFIWQIPQLKVFADALFYNRANDDYEAEDKINAGKDNWKELIENYQIDTIVIPQVYFPFQTPAYELENWQLVYIDGISKVYAKKNIIKNKIFDLSMFRPEIFEKQKFKKEDQEKALKTINDLLNADPQNAFARTQLIESYMENDIQKAKSLTENSRQLSPNDPYYSLYLVRIYAKLNQCQQAKDFAQEAKSKSYNDFFINLEIKNALSNCQNPN